MYHSLTQMSPHFRYSLSFFSADALARSDIPKYALLLESAKVADAIGFLGVWVPERHFQAFGGLYGSPSVAAATLAAVTKRLRICAGSVVLPLHDPLRVAEEWSMIDNISNGRVTLAFASGWHINDFVLSNCPYERRHEDMYEKIEIVRTLWAGGKIRRRNGAGHDVEVGILPQPVQQDVPIALTAGSDETFLRAAEMGFNVLTSNFANRSLSTLRRRIGKYREVIREKYNRFGHVTMMAHSFVGASNQDVLEKAKPALIRYVNANLELQREQEQGSGVDSVVATLTPQQRDDIVDGQVFRNMCGPLSFVGTVEQCREQARVLQDAGVDELACLIDFGVSIDDVLASLHRMSQMIQN
jgi:natural product biosynthesis luciferase-like monooxygenase protein